MSLQSPNPASQLSSRSISRLRAGSIESDGYSEVFDSEEYSENSQPVPLSSGLTTLINAPFSHSSAITTSTGTNEVCMCVLLMYTFALAYIHVHVYTH